MKIRRALLRCLLLAVAITVLVVALAAVGVGFDGVAASEWAIGVLLTFAALAWFDEPASAGVAMSAPRRRVVTPSRFGIALALALTAAWLGPRRDEPAEATAVEAWVRDDAVGGGWPLVRVHSRNPTRVAQTLGEPANESGGHRWALTVDSAPFIAPRHNPPLDEPSVGWALPPAALRLAGIPSQRRQAPWLAKRAGRVAFADDGIDIGPALTAAPLDSVFPPGGSETKFRIAKPFTRGVMAWSTGTSTVRAEAAHLLAGTGMPPWPDHLPPGTVPLLGLNANGEAGFLPLAAVLADDDGRLTAVQYADEPSAVDLLGEAGEATGPAQLDGWLPAARSRTAAAPALIVLPRELPWRRPFVGCEVLVGRGTPRPTPRDDEAFNGWEVFAALVAAGVLMRLIVAED